MSAAEKLVELLKSLNPLLKFEIPNYNIYTECQWIDVRGGNISGISLPPGATLQGNDVSYNGFKIHLVPLP